jgi:DNA polymerase IV
VIEVGGTLRANGFRARTVTVRLRDGDFTTRQASRTLSLPVESDRAIFRVARELLAELRRRRRTPARLLGVGVSGLEDAEGPVQLALLDSGDTDESERDRSLARASDDLRSRFGRKAVLPGTMLDSDRIPAEPMDDDDI